MINYKKISIILSALVLSFTLSYVFAVWQEPAASPPSGNVEAPINISTTAQTKQGALQINADFTANRLIDTVGGGSYYIDPAGISNLATTTFMGGNVGIGTTNPGYKLDVTGRANATELCIAGACQNSWPGGGGGGLQLIKDFVVDSGQTITAGDVVSFIDNKVRKGVGISFGSKSRFQSAATVISGAAVLSDTSFVVVFADPLNSSRRTAIIGTISGTDISWGSKYVFSTETTTYFSVAALSSESFVVFYRSAAGGTAKIGIVSSGTVISWGPEYTFGSMNNAGNSVIALSPEKFVAVYTFHLSADYPAQGMARIGTVLGTTISFGSAYLFNPDETEDLRVVALSSDSFVITYSDWDGHSYTTDATNIVGTVSGTTISYGSEYIFKPYNWYSPPAEVANLSSDKFVLLYNGGSLWEWYSSSGLARIGTVVSSNAISYSDDYVFASTTSGGGFNTRTHSITALSPTSFVGIYAHDSYPYAAIGSVSGDFISVGSEYLFNSTSTYSGSNFVLTLSPDKVLIVFSDGSNTRYPSAVVGTVAGAWSVGIAKNSAIGGQNVPVIIGGVSDAHTGLAPGIVYYAETDGSLTVLPNARRVGLAISPTEILLDSNRANSDQIF